MQTQASVPAFLIAEDWVESEGEPMLGFKVVGVLEIFLPKQEVQAIVKHLVLTLNKLPKEK